MVIHAETPLWRARNAATFMRLPRRAMLHQRRWCDFVRLILTAIDLHRLHRLSFWDALIVRAAQAGGCGVLLSEDMQDGQVYDGLRIENPSAR